MTPIQAIDRAIAHFGSEIGLARAIHYTAPAVRRARANGMPSAEMACCIEYVTRGKVKRTDLRPDIFGLRVRMIENAWNRRRTANERAA